MRTLLVVLLMTCVSVCHANPSQQNESNVVRKTIIVNENAAASPQSAPVVQKNVIVKKNTPQTVIVKEVSPRASHKTVIVREVPPPVTHKTIVVKKHVKKRKVCKRYYQNGRTYCEERVAPQRVEVRRVYEDEDDFDVSYVEPRPRTRYIAAPAGVYYQATPIGLNLHVRL